MTAWKSRAKRNCDAYRRQRVRRNTDRRNIKGLKENFFFIKTVPIGPADKLRETMNGFLLKFSRFFKPYQTKKRLFPRFNLPLNGKRTFFGYVPFAAKIISLPRIMISIFQSTFLSKCRNPLSRCASKAT